MSQEHADTHSTAWVAQVWLSFAIAMMLTVSGIALLPVDLWARGYVLMGLMFTTGSAFTLAKTTRDQLETKKLRNRISSAKTNRILKEFEEES